MLTSLEIERFRCFRSFTLDRLARVNLVVGVNNAGKTALLEAAEILLQRGDPAVFWRQARRRGEMIRAKDPEREQAESCTSSTVVPRSPARSSTFEAPSAESPRR